MSSNRGAGVARSGRGWLGRAGCWCYDEARGAGGVLAVRAAGCRGLRKVCGRALAKMRGLAGKEGGVFGRDRIQWESVRRRTWPSRATTSSIDKREGCSALLLRAAWNLILFGHFFDRVDSSEVDSLIHFRFIDPFQLQIH